MKLKQSLTPKLTKYIPHSPTPKQRAFLLLNNREAFFGGAAGGGKKSAKEQVIATPTGFRQLGDLNIGNLVVDPRTGGATSVIGIHDEDHQQIWRVHFEDGAHTDVHRDHLWALRRSGRRNKSA